MKKGFTLIELIAVIVILSIVLLITFPIVSNLVTKSNNRLYDAQVKSVEDAANTFAFDYYYSVSELDEFTIELNLLKKLAYVESDLINVKTNEKFSDNSLITISNNNGNFTSEFILVDDTTNLDSTEYNNYIVVLKGSYLYGGTIANTDNVLIFDSEGLPVTGTSISTSTTASVSNRSYTTVSYSFNINGENYYISRDEKE